MFNLEALLKRLRGDRKRSHDRPKALLQRLRSRQGDSTEKSPWDDSPQVKIEMPQELTPDYPPMPEPQPAPVAFVLDIRNESDMADYLRKLKNLRGFDNFRRNLLLNWLQTHLARVEKKLAGISSLRNFDEDFNSKLANAVRGLSRHMLDIYRDAETSPHLNEGSRQQLRALVEEYLSSIGVEEKTFHVGDAFDDWADLGMENSYGQVSTSDRALDWKLAEIKIQPHVIRYRNENGETTDLTFGGMCRVYKFKG